MSTGLPEPAPIGPLLPTSHLWVAVGITAVDIVSCKNFELQACADMRGGELEQELQRIVIAHYQGVKGKRRKVW